MKHIIKKIREINEDTAISVGLMIVIVTLVVWFTTLHSDVNEAKANIENIDRKQEQYSQDMKTIIRKLTRIEDHLGISEGEQK